MTILDPLAATQRIEQRYRGYLHSTFRPRDPDLRRDFEHALDKDFVLTRGPYLQASAPFENGGSVRSLVAEGVLHPDFLRMGVDAFPTARPLYRHQEEAVRKAVTERRNLVVSTGTGSGKTEAFLLPIIDALLREQEAGTLSQPGVRALLLYPMNALANDQVKRLRSVLADLPEITFGRYVGDTKHNDAEAEESFRSRFPGETQRPNELLSRARMQEAPPHILLTNYAMLEYLLLRPDDSSLFDGPTGEHWRFVVMDEAHVYGGAQGTEVAMLLRRVRDRVVRSEVGRLQCFATSATLGSGPEDHPELVRFASDLFGEPFECSKRAHDVVIGHRRPLVAGEALHTLAAGDIQAMQAAYRAGDRQAVTEHARSAPVDPPTPGDDLEPWLYDVLAHESHVIRVQSLLETGSVELGRVADRVFDAGDGNEETLVALVDLCVAARPRADDAPLIPARYHFFLRSLESGFLCRHPNHPVSSPRLRLARHKECEPCKRAGIDASMFELGVCRGCRVEYLVGQRERGEGKHPRFRPSPPQYGASEYLLLEPPVDDDEDEVASRGTSTAAVVPMQLCTSCAVVTESEGGCGCNAPAPISVHHVSPVKGEALHTCPVCLTRTSGEVVMRLVTGTDAPASVIATDLYQAIPPSRDPMLQTSVGQGRKLLTFSDSRQDAAFFAAYLDRTYSRAVERRLLAGAIRSLASSGVPRAGDVALKVRQDAEACWLLDVDRSTIENNREAGSWVLQEILALDRRQSIEGAGVAEISVAVPRAWEPPRPLLELGLTPDECRDLVQLLLETVRSSGAVLPPDHVDLRNDRFAPRNRPVHIREQGSETGILSWLPASSSATNRRVEIMEKVLLAKGSDADPIELLRGLWRHFVDANGSWRDTFRSEPVAKKGVAWRLNWDRFEFRLLADDHRPGRCTRCRRLFWRSIDNTCPGWRCDGTVAPVTDIGELERDHYARLFLDLDPSAMTVFEHTAMWTSEKAARLQDQFVAGRVNALSCSTTFELGVDVGEVQAVFLRNVPPTPANYVQRAGRAGRRADSAALVVTFAQRRSHDLTHFDDPRRMVDGSVAPPRILLDNATIVRRHVHSVAFARFERECADAGIRHARVSDFFLAPDPGTEPADVQFADWLRQHPAVVQEALLRLLPDSVRGPLEVDSWGWVTALLEESETEPMYGWLTRAGSQIRAEIQQLDDLFEEAREAGKGGLMERYRRVRATFATRHLLGALASRNVLPKYGFPVDVVELNVAGSGDADASDLDMSRDLTMAISEYAPGAQVVAAKSLWVGTGVATRTGHGWPTFVWGQCNDCGAYRHAFETLPPCNVCGAIETRPGKSGTVVVPVFGFLGERGGKPGDTRPPRGALIERFFGSYGGEPPELEPVTELEGPTPLQFRVSRQGRINVVNRGPQGRGYLLCEWCGAGRPAPGGPRESRAESHDDARRPGKCKGTLRRRHLGHEYLTDVLELRIGEPMDEATALSVLYALIEGAGALTISADDIDGALFTYAADASAGLILFDTVAGGAGHAQRIGENLERVLRAALTTVELCGSCGPETSCYSCLRSYRNQGKHDDLSRGAAAAVLRRMLERDDSRTFEHEVALFSDEVRPLVRSVVQAGATMPEAGWELDDGRVIEAAWPDLQVGIVNGIDETAWPAGWQIATQESWDAEELTQLVTQG